jgi:hypothetical protein
VLNCLCRCPGQETVKRTIILLHTRGRVIQREVLAAKLKKKISAISQPERSSDGNINGARGVEQQEEESKRVKKTQKKGFLLKLCGLRSSPRGGGRHWGA